MEDVTLLEKGYIAIRVLGSGAFGQVMLVKRTDGSGKLAAVKKISCQTPNDAQTAMQEARTLTQASHNFILHLIQYFTDSSNCIVYLVTEFCEKGSLRDQLFRGPICWNLRIQWYDQLVEGLAHLHFLNIVHRDLKPENVMVTRDMIKIADFGLATMLERVNFSQYSPSTQGASMQEYMATVCGTKLYMAPEIFQERYTKKADIFSLGLIFLIIAERKWVRDDNSWYYGILAVAHYQTCALGRAMLQNLHHGHGPDRVYQQYVESLMFTTATAPEIALIKSMLHPSYTRRPTACDAKNRVREIKEEGQSLASILYSPLGSVCNSIGLSHWWPGSHYN